jgi:hypothetical protein
VILLVACLGETLSLIVSNGIPCEEQPATQLGASFVNAGTLVVDPVGATAVVPGSGTDAVARNLRQLLHATTRFLEQRGDLTRREMTGLRKDVAGDLLLNAAGGQGMAERQLRHTVHIPLQRVQPVVRLHRPLEESFLNVRQPSSRSRMARALPPWLTNSLRGVAWSPWPECRTPMRMSV